MRTGPVRDALCAVALCGAFAGEAHARQGGRGARPLPEPAAAAARAWPDTTSWRHIGPAAFGGRVDDIEAVVGNPNIIFVASAAGGVFRSTNRGTTWTAVSDPYFATASVGDIAIAPSDPRIVWAGMGEPNNRQSSTWGDGVYKSEDGGTTWRHMGLRETQSIGRIVIDPRNPDVVFVAAVGHLFGPNDERGLYRTRDGGATWRKVLEVDEHTGATDVIMTPDGRTLVAAMYQRRRRAFGFAGSGSGSGLWRSTDGGDTWRRVTSGLPQGDLGRIGLDVSRSDPDIMYAVVEARNIGGRAGAGVAADAIGGGVFRSTDGGASWTRQSGANPRPSYFSQIRIDPVDSDRVWLLGVYLAVSTDGGRTFSTDSVSGYAHPDHHAMWIDPDHPEQIMLGNDGGVYFSYDTGRTWVYADNLPLAQFYDIVIDEREPYWIYGGTQDNGSWAFPSATYSRGGMTGDQVVNTVFGDGFQAAVDPLDARFVYANSQNGRLFLADLVTREEHHIQPVSPTPAEPYRFNWNTANHVSPNDPTVYYMGAQKLLRTTDRGQSWQEISPDLTKGLGRMPVGPPFPERPLSANDGVSAYGNITTISESPVASARGSGRAASGRPRSDADSAGRRAGTIYVGTDDGNVQMTTDGGGRWTDLTARFSFPDADRPASYVSKVLASRHDARTAYVAFDGHWDDDMRPYVFRTTDGGGSWQSIASDLPDWKPVRTIAEDPRDPDVLYAGTEFGLYWTVDGGRSWAAASGNMPPVPVMKVIVDETNGDLIVATHGRGVMILDDASPLADGDPASWTDEVRLFPVRTATQVQRYREFPQPGADVFVAPNPPAGTFITYGLTGDPPSGDAADSVTIEVVAADGSVVSEMMGPDSPGIHRVVWDLRYRFAYVPPPQDSGFYGPPRAAPVPPGQYTVKLTARGRERTQPVEVRWDPRGASTPEGLAARTAINAQGRELARAFYETTRAIEAFNSELERLSTISRERPAAGADSTIADLTARLTQIRQRSTAGMGSLPGNLFDLLAAVESSSLPPTDAQQQLITTIVDNSVNVVSQINDVITNRMPGLRARLGQPPSLAVRPVGPPR
jgi:photosystem II stability/assembly factor-like uncharacterized protein